MKRIMFSLSPFVLLLSIFCKIRWMSCTSPANTTQERLIEIGNDWRSDTITNANTISGYYGKHNLSKHNKQTTTSHQQQHIHGIESSGRQEKGKIRSQTIQVMCFMIFLASFFFIWIHFELQCRMQLGWQC